LFEKPGPEQEVGFEGTWLKGSLGPGKETQAKILPGSKPFNLSLGINLPSGSQTKKGQSRTEI